MSSFFSQWKKETGRIKQRRDSHTREDIDPAPQKTSIQRLRLFLTSPWFYLSYCWWHVVCWGRKLLKPKHETWLVRLQLRRQLPRRQGQRATRKRASGMRNSRSSHSRLLRASSWHALSTCLDAGRKKAFSLPIQGFSQRYPYFISNSNSWCLLFPTDYLWAASMSLGLSLSHPWWCCHLSSIPSYQSIKLFHTNGIL
jgi:hypothetical protein